MTNEIILKKLEQLLALLKELDKLLSVSFDEFQKEIVSIRAAERDFQLIVDLASDINTQILLMRGQKTPDTYRQSFIDLAKDDILSSGLARRLALSAGLRNILVHEYDFEEDYKKFYESARGFTPFYKEYVKVVHNFVSKLQ